MESRFEEAYCFKPAQDQEWFLIEERLKALSPPQRGLGVTGKSSTPREKISCLVFG